MKKISVLFILMGLIAFVSCSKEPDEIIEPDRVTVQHILIAFIGTIPGDEVTRTKEEAESLAMELGAR